MIQIRSRSLRRPAAKSACALSARLAIWARSSSLKDETAFLTCTGSTLADFIAFSAIGEERNCCTVWILCCRTSVLFTISFCRSAGFTTWDWAMPSVGRKKKVINAQAVSTRANCFRSNGMVGKPPVVSRPEGKFSIYDGIGCNGRGSKVTNVQCLAGTNGHARPLLLTRYESVGDLAQCIGW